MEIVLALTSALFFAFGSVLQQRAGVAAPSDGAHSGLLLRMARRPVWLVGIACDGLGFVTQATALGLGRLDVVQPLLVTSVVFALPLGVRLSHQRLRRGDLVAAIAVVLALGAFIVIANPAGGRGEAPLADWLVAAIACAAVCVPLTMLGRRGPAARRAAMLGAAAGVLFALSASLTKAVVDELHRGVVHVVASWELYALIAVGYVSMTLNQLALNTGALAATLATSTALDPIGSVVLGVTVFRESPQGGALRLAGIAATLGVVLAGVVALARTEAHVAAPGAR